MDFKVISLFASMKTLVQGKSIADFTHVADHKFSDIIVRSYWSLISEFHI